MRKRHPNEDSLLIFVGGRKKRGKWRCEPEKKKLAGNIIKLTATFNIF